MKPYDVASRVEAREGTVLVNGPDGVAYAMTAAAARRTAELLAACADAAEKQLAEESEPPAPA